MSSLVVIPARGGSRGIPRKNTRYLGGLPLIQHVCLAAKNAKHVDHVLVSTDDEEIAFHAKQVGALVHMRTNPELSNDKATLDGVIYDAVCAFEATHGAVDYVITCQPTSPLLRSSSIDSGIERLMQGDIDTVISVVDSTHLSWTKDEQGRAVPLFKERVNRQWLQPTFRETGGVIGARRDAVNAKSRIGKRVHLLVLDHSEGLDIDEPTD